MLLVIQLQKRRQPSRLASNIVFLASALNRLNVISDGRLVRFIRLKACFFYLELQLLKVEDSFFSKLFI